MLVYSMYWYVYDPAFRARWTVWTPPISNNLISFYLHLCCYRCAWSFLKHSVTPGRTKTNACLFQTASSVSVHSLIYRLYYHLMKTMAMALLLLFDLSESHEGVSSPDWRLVTIAARIFTLDIFRHRLIWLSCTHTIKILCGLSRERRSEPRWRWIDPPPASTLNPHPDNCDWRLVWCLSGVWCDLCVTVLEEVWMKVNLMTIPFGRFEIYSSWKHRLPGAHCVCSGGSLSYHSQ